MSDIGTHIPVYNERMQKYFVIFNNMQRLLDILTCQKECTPVA